MPIAYMIPTGEFAINCESFRDKPHPDLVEAPEGGCYDMRWTGDEWVDDPTAQSKVDAFFDPLGALERERATMSCTRLQAMLTLGEDQWNTVSTVLASQPWEVRARFNDADIWTRNNQLINMLGAQVLGLTDTQLDDLFRLAVTK